MQAVYKKRVGGSNVRRVLASFTVLLVLLSGLMSAANAQSYNPNVPPPAVVWTTAVDSSYTGPSEFSTPQEACIAQHSFNPGAPLQNATYRWWNSYDCHWTAKQDGGPEGSNTILASAVFAKCAASTSGEWVQAAPGVCQERYDLHAACGKCPAGGHPSQGISTTPNPSVGNPIQLETGFKLRFDTDYASADGLLRVDRQYRSGFRNYAQYSLADTPGFGSHWFGVYPGRLYIAGDRTDIAEFLPASGGALLFQAPYNDTSSYVIIRRV